MSICDRYTKREEDAIEVFNDAFLKIFKEIHRFKPSYTDEVSSFKGWVRKIMIHTAIDYNRKHHKHAFTADIDKSIIYIPAGGEDALDMISYDEIIMAIRELSPAYSTVLNMFIIDGLSHEEISTHLQIAVGTSKSNLSKAKQQLQKLLKKDNLTREAKNVG
jgi:RNA polymerase sigma-70 factor (ECF subfamily)